MSLISEIHNDLEKGALRLMVEYRARLFSDAVRLCGNPTDADDLVSRTFAKAIGKLDTYKEDDNLYGWLKTILSNLHRNDLERPVARGTVPVDDATLEQYAGADDSTMDQLMRNSDHDALRDAINQLDPEYKKAVAMYYFNELSLKEIAAFLETSTSSVSRKLQIARRILAAKLGTQLGKKPVAIVAALLLSVATAFGAWKAADALGWLPESASVPVQTPMALQFADKTISATTSQMTATINAAATPTDSKENERTAEMNLKTVKTMAVAATVAALATTASAEKMCTTFTTAVNGSCNVSLGTAFRAAGSGVHIIPTDFATLAEALASDRVLEGDVIRFKTGTHVFDASDHITDETTTYRCLGAIRKSVIVEGSGNSPNDTQIDCGGSGGIIVDNPEAVVRNLSFTNFVNTTAKAEPLFYVKQGVASNVWVNGAMPGEAKTYKGIKSFVYVGSGALFADSQVFAVTNIQWDGANLVSLNAGTMRRCKLFRNYIQTSIAHSAASPSSIEDCEFSDNYGYSCGGANCAKKCNVRNTIFTRNQSSAALALLLASGSGAYGCRMIGNVYNASYKSGVVLQCNGWTSITVENCLIANNHTHDVAPIGLGGSHGEATFRNTTIANNDSKIGTISCFCGSDNGTSEANKLTLVNTVIYGNTAGGAVQTFNPLSIYTTYDIRHCNYPEADPNDGKGNFYADPRFADAANGDYQLGKGSPCVDVGEEISTLTEDIDGTERPQDGDGDGIALWDVGCYEKLPTTTPVECTLAASLTGNVAPGKVALTATVTGSRITGLSFAWMAIRELSGVVTTNTVVSQEATHEFTGLGIGNYRFACLVTNDAFPPDSALDETTVAETVYPETTYVSLTGGNVWPYASEETAARNFSDAANCAGRKVVIAPGVYKDCAHVTDAATGYDCIGAIRRGVVVEGGAKADDVVFDCGGMGGILLGHSDARIYGVTFTNFMAAAGSGPALYVEAGSASNVVVNGGTTLTELGTCVYFGEYAVGDEINIFGLNHAKSGGAPLLQLYGATLRNSRFENCSVANSDYAAQTLPAERGTRSRIECCQFVGNTAKIAGALYAKNTDIYRSNFEGNSNANGNKESYAAAVRFGQSSMTACTVVGNSGQDVLGFDQIWSSDAYVGAITNCLIANNTSGACPALDVNSSNTKVDIVNCTIANNRSVSNKSGTAKSGGIGWLKPGTAPRVTVVNTITWGNTVDGEVKDLPADMDTKITISISHCCFSEADDWAMGPGNIAKDPRLYSGRRFGMLRGGSPCIDAGDNLGWTAEDVDLAGATRLYNKLVDIGCYEKGPVPGLMITVK